MRHVKVLGLCLVAVFALAAMTASGASAKAGAVLQLNEGVTKAGNEAPASAVVAFAQCYSFNSGHLTGNDAATVTQVATATVNECAEGKELTGGFTSAAVSAKGTLTLTGSLTLTKEIGEETGPCKYTFSKWKKLKFTLGGPLNLETPVTGKLVKAGSNKDCAKTAAKEANVGLQYPSGPFEAVFNAVLVP